VGLVREWVRRQKRKPAKFIYFPQFLDDMRQMFGDTQQAQQAQQYENQLAKFDLLVIDDLGAERTSDWVVERVNVLLDRRMREGRQTIVTTNLMDLGAVSERYGARAASRLGGYRWRECSGSDHRLLV
jgi:DNA replication protein DnaC